MTEFGPVLHCCPVNVNNPNSSAIPVLNTCCKIVNIETGEELGPNCDHEGELLVKGPQVRMHLN